MQRWAIKRRNSTINIRVWRLNNRREQYGEAESLLQLGELYCNGVTLADARHLENLSQQTLSYLHQAGCPGGGA